MKTVVFLIISVTYPTIMDRTPSLKPCTTNPPPIPTPFHPHPSPDPPPAASIPCQTTSNNPNTIQFITLDGDHELYTLNDDDENHTPFEEAHDLGGYNDPNDGDAEEAIFMSQKGIFVFPPTLKEADSAFQDITKILKPPQAKGQGYKDAGLNRVTTVQLEGIKMFLQTYSMYTSRRKSRALGKLDQGSEETVSFSVRKRTTP